MSNENKIDVKTFYIILLLKAIFGMTCAIFTVVLSTVASTSFSVVMLISGIIMGLGSTLLVVIGSYGTLFKIWDRKFKEMEDEMRSL